MRNVLSDFKVLEIGLKSTPHEVRLTHPGLLPGRYNLRGKIPGDPATNVNSRFFGHSRSFFFAFYEIKGNISGNINKRLLFLNNTI